MLYLCFTYALLMLYYPLLMLYFGEERAEAAARASCALLMLYLRFTYALLMLYFGEERAEAAARASIELAIYISNILVTYFSNMAPLHFWQGSLKRMGRLNPKP
jgi:hypothetical protein